jgi:hypothetical protein
LDYYDRFSGSGKRPFRRNKPQASHHPIVANSPAYDKGDIGMRVQDNVVREKKYLTTG